MKIKNYEFLRFFIQFNNETYDFIIQQFDNIAFVKIKKNLLYELHATIELYKEIWHD